jgi:hypothetical protein
LNANLGCFTAEAGVAAVDDEDVVVCTDGDGDGDGDDDLSDEVVIDVAEGVAFRGGAGGV